MGASNMSSETKGVAALIRKDEQIVIYFHGMMHCFNLCASQSVNVASIRNCIDAVREIIGFVGFQEITSYLKQSERLLGQCLLEETVTPVLLSSIPVY